METLTKTKKNNIVKSFEEDYNIFEYNKTMSLEGALTHFVKKGLSFGANYKADFWVDKERWFDSSTFSICVWYRGDIKSFQFISEGEYENVESVVDSFDSIIKQQNQIQSYLKS